MGSPRPEASTSVPSSLQSVLPDHTYGKMAGVKEFSMVIKVEQTDTGEDGDGGAMWKGENQSVKKENTDFDGEEQKMEDPVGVFLIVPKEEGCDESMEYEEDMLARDLLTKVECPENNCFKAEKPLPVTSSWSNQCEECGTKFDRKEDLLAHYRSQHGYEKLKCPQKNCQKTFNHRSNMVKHTRAKHNSSSRAVHNKVLKCPDDNCNYEFTLKEHLQAHLRHKLATRRNRREQLNQCK